MYTSLASLDLSEEQRAGTPDFSPLGSLSSQPHRPSQPCRGQTWAAGIPGPRAQPGQHSTKDPNKRACCSRMCSFCSVVLCHCHSTQQARPGSQCPGWASQRPQQGRPHWRMLSEVGTSESQKTGGRGLLGCALGNDLSWSARMLILKPRDQTKPLANEGKKGNTAPWKEQEATAWVLIWLQPCALEQETSVFCNSVSPSVKWGYQ